MVMDFMNEAYDVTKNRPKTKYPTVLDQLNINDPTVKNLLIDQRKIESILLLPDRSHSAIIEKHSNPNCFQAFLLNGDQLIGLPSFRYYSSNQKEIKYFVQSTQQAIE